MEDIHRPSARNSPPSSDSSPTSDSGPPTPPLLSDPFGSPTLHTRVEDKSKMDLSPPTSSCIPIPSPHQLDLDPGKHFPEKKRSSVIRPRTVSSNQRMRRMSSPRKYRPSAHPLEARFTMRSLGVTSHTSLSIEDVVEGKNIFQEGLLDMPENVFEKFYAAKVAARDTILSRVSSSLRGIDALEKIRNAGLAFESYNTDSLASNSKDLESYKAELPDSAKDLEDRIAYGHAVYIDELAALTVANAQLQYMLDPSADLKPKNQGDLVCNNNGGTILSSHV